MSHADLRAAAPTLLWLTVSGAALIGNSLVPEAAAPVAAGGAVVALTLLPAPLVTRLLAAAAMAPAAFAGSAPVWSWVVAGALVALGTSRLPRSELQTEPNGDLQRHLAWCRRREEPAHLLIAPLRGIEEQDVRNLLESFRITDSVTLGRSDGGNELYALLDAHGFVREGLERRLAERFSGRRFGWASFPQDGVTLQTLIEHARETMYRAPAPAPGLVAAPEPVLADRTTGAPALEHAAGRS